MAEVRPTHVHFVGSIALDSVEEVFRTCGKTLGRRLKRLPDGEPGGRRLWVSWQLPLLRASPYLEPLPGVPLEALAPLRLAEGVQPGEIGFGELGYCREARISYQDFAAARGRGEIAADTRFQVSLPTPFAVISTFVRGEGMLAVAAAYEQAMIREAQAICAAIPHEDLCIQWDVCIEMLIWDGQPSIVPPLPDKQQVLPPALARLCDAIPTDVEVGIHLCYGDMDAKHFVEPADMGAMVSLANAIAATAEHPLAYVHMPVPIARDDETFFGPLRELALDPGTEVYLGLIHDDGAEGAARRIAAARTSLDAFGVATECGIARKRTPEMVRRLISAHAQATAEPA
ncbi:hypothetical protein [Sphingosinicella terrae]|uniref:hypothetical protein n=1 Tax=Sphingosinicella terrae TaxID=2172047 RepID=UPI000E0D3C2F|nr:hypothetical protein [Sphingosinicella terrae]